MATLDQLMEDQDIQPLRPTTLTIEGMRQKQIQRSLIAERLRKQEKFIREVGAPDHFQVVGAPYVVDRKKEADEYELKKNMWAQRNLM